MVEQRVVTLTEAKYDARLTAEQKEILINFMAEHPDFARGKLLGVQGRKKKNALWEVLATQLNACGGPEKNTAKWQRVWTDLKNKSKKKASEIKQSRRQTGGGPPSGVKLTELENQIIDIITEEAVHGLANDGIPLDTAELPREAEKENLPPTAPIEVEIEHDYVLKNSTMSLPSPSVSEVLSEATAVSSGGASHSSRPTHRRMTKPTTAEAVQTFAAIGAELNAKIDVIGERLMELIEERRQTNVLLQDLVYTIKQKL